MALTRSILVAASAFMTWSAVADAQPAASAPNASDQAKVLFTEAEEARQKKDFATCVDKSERAYALFPHVQIRGLQGMCELELGRFVDAATHLGFFVESSTVDVPVEAKKAFDEAEGRVVKLMVSCNPTGTTITLDGKSLGKAPLTLYVEPGERVVAASIPGVGSKQERRTMVAGTKVSVVLDLKGSTTEAPRSEGLPVWPGVVGIVVGAVGVGVGATLVGVAAGEDADAESAGAGLRCSPARLSAACASLQSSLDTRDGLHAGGVAALIAGGAVLTFGVAWTVVAASSGAEEATARLEVVPLVGGTNGVGLKFSY